MSIYRKSVRHLDEIDIYQIGNLYEVKSHAVFHALKKLLCAGKRGTKDYEHDLMEAIEAIERELQIVGLPSADEPGFCGDDPRKLADFDEQRMDAIGQNGNGGEHYELSVDLSRVTPHGFGCVTEINLNWKDAVDWSLASPHHQFAFLGANGVISFSMHQPMGYDFIGRPVAQ